VSIATLVTVWTAMLSIFRPHELYLSCAARQTLAYCNRKAIVRRTEAHPNDEFLPDSTLKSKQHSVREIVGLMMQLESVSSPIRLKSPAKTFFSTDLAPQKTYVTTVD
jgi:hypothetical protein